MFRFHKLMRRSSADMYVSPSEFMLIELMWYACAFAYTLRGTAATILSWKAMRGNRNWGVCPFSANVEPFCARGELLGWKSEVLREPEDNDDADRLFSATTRSDFSKTFQSLMVLSATSMAVRPSLKSPRRTHHWLKAESGLGFDVCTI